MIAIALARLLKSKLSEVKGGIRLYRRDKMCLHCCRCYIIDYLGPIDVTKMDQVWPQEFWCSCDD